ncbi:MAG: alpha/beta fold hydrolase [Chloroflexi bacterium]|nr:alpha/beta fold hydrolase [Chloroflexota bacterium]
MTSNAPERDSVPFFFGPPGKALFGNYHESAPGQDRDCGILLCAPAGQEYIRSHRAFRQLALRLSRAGFPVLRFDYYGCGDSNGDDDQGHLTQWLADIAAAGAELKKRSGADRLCLIGLRLGAALALLAAARRNDLDGLVLWEAAINGRTYVDELAVQHRDTLWRYFAQPEQHANGHRPSELLGFPLTETIWADLEKLDLLTVRQKPASHVLLIENSEDPAAEQLGQHLRGLGCQVNYQHIPGPRIWAEDPDKALVPQQVLQAIVAWASEALP